MSQVRGRKLGEELAPASYLINRLATLTLCTEGTATMYTHIDDMKMGI